MTTSSEFHQFVENLKEKAAEQEERQLWMALHDALNLGSSGLEIVGAIRWILLENEPLVRRLLGGDPQGQLNAAISFVDRAYGRSYS